MKEWRRGQQIILNALKKNTAFSEGKHGSSYNKIQLQSGDIDAAEWFKFQTFATAVIEDEKLRIIIKQKLAKAIEQGQTKSEFYKELKDDFKQFKAGSIKKLNTVFETQQALAFGAAQQAKMIEVADDFPFWKYSALHDAVTRPDHLVLDGRIFEVTDQRFYPPIAINCRCTAIPLTASQAGRTNPDLFVHPKQALNEDLANSDFVGNKQKSFVKWLGKKAEQADPESKQLLNDAAERLLKKVNTPLVKIAERIYYEPGAEKQSEFTNNKATAEILSEKWKTNVTLLKPIDGQRNYDAVVFNKEFEFKDTNTNKWTTLDKDLRKGKDQAPNITLKIGGYTTHDVIIKAFENRLKKSKTWESFTLIRGERILMLKNGSYNWDEFQKKIKELLS